MSDPANSAPRVEIAGSRRELPAADRVGPVDPTATATVTVYVRDPAPSPEVSDPGPVMSREEFQAAHSAAPADLSAVLDLAATFGVAVGEVSAGRRSVQLFGTVAALSEAFGADIALYRHPDTGIFRGRTGPLTVPATVAPVITGVFGLDDRTAARAQFRPSANPAIQYIPPQVAQAYHFPTTVDGAGQCVGIVELGGGFRVADLTAYFAQIGVAQPTVVAVSVDGGANVPGTPNGPDGEVMLDIEVIGGLAPGARIAVYFAPNTDQGFVDAITTAVHDTTNRPSVISISWGAPESSWTQQAMQQMEDAFVAAAAVGVTITAASGDNGSTDGVTDGKQHVDFPASAPHALACGGTALQASGQQITSETVWNSGAGGGATGGGISDVWPVPAYQQSVTLPPSVNDGMTRRGVPDVAGDADPNTGWTIRVDGQTISIGGTSAVAPLWAGLTALLNQALGTPLGLAQPRLYQAAVAATMHDITSGDNGAYRAGKGWDACTGLGTPDGTNLLAALKSTNPPPTTS
jgi:kumamolisin